MDINKISELTLFYEYEDELPKNISSKVFAAMFRASILDFVRLYPYTKINGERYFLIKLEDDNWWNIK